MANPLTLARVWRILKEVDLEAIRREADTPLRVLVMAETAGEADDLAVLMTGGEAASTAWVTAMDAPLAAAQAGAPDNPVVDGPDLVIAVRRAEAISPALKTAQRVWAERRARMVTVAVEPGAPRASRVRTRNGAAGVTVPRLDAEALSPIAGAIFAVVRPDQRLALAREFAGLRPCLFDDLISETAKANAGYAFSTGLAEIIPVLDIPLNIGDVIVLTKNQLVMAYRLALAAGKQGKPTELIGEILGVLGGGIVFRQIARQLIGLVPVLGLVPKVAVAYGGTWAIGRAVVVWAAEREKLTAQRLKELSKEGLARGKKIAQAMKAARKGTAA